MERECKRFKASLEFYENSSCPEISWPDCGWEDYYLADILVCQRKLRDDQIFFRLSSGQHLPCFTLSGLGCSKAASFFLVFRSGMETLVWIDGAPTPLSDGTQVCSDLSTESVVSIDPIKTETLVAIVPKAHAYALAIDLRHNVNELKVKFLEQSYLVIDDFLECPPDVGSDDWTDDIEAAHHWYESKQLFHSLLDENIKLFLQAVSGFPRLDRGKLSPWKKFGPGSYVILNEMYPEPFGLDIIYFLCDQSTANDSGNRWVYLDSDGDEILSIFPARNRLAIIYRSAPEDNEGVKRFRQYTSLSSSNSPSIEYTHTFEPVFDA